MGSELLKEETIAGPRNGITIDKIEQNLKDLTRVESPKEAEEEGEVVEGLDFNFEDKDDDDDASKMLRVKPNCDRVIIRRCRFRNKANEDPALVIANSKNVVVEDCIFENMRGGDKREAIRIAGDGRESGLSLKCTVRRCIFRNNSGDDEIISIKSAENTIEDCFFIKNNGNLTVRHGGLTKIHHNYFEGKNGVRIHGYGNRVEYNCFEDNNSATDDEKMRCPISLWWGDEDKDPNWDWEEQDEGISRPSGSMGSNTHSVYARTVDTVVKENEFKNCRNAIVVFRRKDEHDKKPKNTKEENNKTLKDNEEFTFKTQG
jgi:hypothetical protein